MGELTEKHRPIMAGIAIKRLGAASGPGAGDVVTYGTLTAVARRKSDQKNVLVTNLHVVSKKGAAEFYRLDGNESIYQFDASDANKVGTVYVENDKNSWLSTDPSDATTTIADLAALLVKDAGTNTEIATYLGVHLHDSTDAHALRPIVQPVKEPGVNMDLTYIGARAGAGPVTVADPSTTCGYDEQAVDKETGLPITVSFSYPNVVHIDRRTHRGFTGDSGSPLLWEDPDGNYHLCCINFTSALDENDEKDPNYSYAIRASLAERELGVTFGVKAPIAVPGEPGTVRPGRRFRLDGSGSEAKEPGAQVTGYKWEELFGDDSASADFSSTTYRDFTAPSIAGDYQYKLTVEDTNKARHSATVTIAVTEPPVVQFSARPSPNVRPGQEVQLSGDGSYDPEGGPLTYSWKQIIPADLDQMVGVELRDRNLQVATFTAPNIVANLIFEVTVADVKGSTTTARITVNVNTPPVAKPGHNRVVNINSPVTLVGAAEDLDTGHVKAMTYAWSVTSAPSDNAGSSASSTTGTPSSKVMLATPVENGKPQPHKGTFTPTVTGDYVFTLTVTDPGRLSHSDTMKVKAVRESENLLPTNVSALPGYRSIDISWNSVSIATGYEVQVGEVEDGGEIGYKSYTTTALTHRVENLADGTRYYYRVRMTNADGVGPWSAVASVVTSTPANRIPVANAGADQTVEAGASVTLDGSASSDRDGDTLTYSWKQRSGPTVTLSGADTVRATFTAPSSAAKLRFRLTVTDEHGSRDRNAVIITVTAPTSEPTPEPTPPPPTDPPPPPPPCTWTDTGETRNSAFSEWVDADETRNRVLGDWTDKGNMRENQVLLILEKEQTRTITWEKKQTRIHTWEKKQECVSHGSTETRWVDASSTQPRWLAQSRTETRWVACAWEDVSPAETRNREVGIWTDTGNTREDDINLVYEKEQTRTITWEKKQQCTGGGDTSYQWVNASDTETQWVVIPEECSSWKDTGQTRVSSYGTYSRTGRRRGSGANRECEESRTNQRQKEQSCTTNAPYNNTRKRWVSTTSATQARWVSCPDPDPDPPPPPPCGPWGDTGSRRVKSYGSWSDTGQRHYDDIEDRYYKEQERTLTWEKQQKRTSQSGNSSQTRWVNDGTSTETRWVAA